MGNLNHTNGQNDFSSLRVTRQPCQEDLLLFSPKEMDFLETSDEVCPSVYPLTLSLSLSLLVRASLLISLPVRTYLQEYAPQ